MSEKTKPIDKKIAYVTLGDMRTRRSYQAGTRYFIGRALGDYVRQVDFIPLSLGVQHRFRYRVKRRVYHLRGERFCPLRTPGVRDHFASQLGDLDSYDLIVSPDSIAISRLATRTPMLFYTDAVFDQLVEYYPEYSHLCRESIRDGHQQEQEALDRAVYAIYSSHWTADYVRQHFKVSPDKIKVVPFGANLYRWPRYVEQRPDHRERCRLLFVGRQWTRKGGDRAVEIVRTMNETGIPAHLVVVSEMPDRYQTLSYVENPGLLDRSTVKGERALEDLFRSSHYLLLPTVADCTPGVFREAAAYGLPVVTTDTGGNGSIVIDGLNGFLLPVTAPPREFASRIACHFYSRDFEDMRHRARHRFETVLNWDTAIRSVLDLVGETSFTTARPCTSKHEVYL
jgi:glycosyltransferase involved in cell wall biosynthesis